MKANLLRGESEILLDGKRYILRPTFEALHRIEQELGTGLLALAKKLAEGTATLEEQAVIVIHTIEADLSPHAIRQALARSSIAHVARAIAHMFAMVFGGGHDPVKK